MISSDNVRSFIYFFAAIGIVLSAKVNVELDQTDYNPFLDNTYDAGWISRLIRLGGDLLNFLGQEQPYFDKLPNFSLKNDASYDFVVIGAGTAGATIAARLTEIPEVQVLLIEAGSNENSAMDIPVMAHLLQLTEANWKYKTKSSKKYCLGMENNSCNWPRGKVMGGSSVLNYMIATRGGAEDYDRWAAMGNEGWAYKDVIKYFKKLESMDITELRSNSTYHGTEGPVHITYPKYSTQLAKAFLKAGQELGYPIVDYNGKEMIGFSYIQTTIMNGLRLSSNKAYLYPAYGRSNLHVARESMVRKVLINHKNRAVGVEFMKLGQIFTVHAKKEVILCAGTIGSAQLLMMSGVGPAKHLAGLGIDVVKDAPVGENLMDHVAYGGLTYLTNDSLGIQTFDMINLFNPYITDYFTKRTGPYTIPGACEALAFINTKHPEKRSGLPDIELLFVGGGFKGDIFLPLTMNLNAGMRKIWDKYFKDFGWTILPMLLRPKSRGRIRLLANDINVKPEIVPNYFDNPEDVKTMIAGIKAAMTIGQTKAMTKFGSRLTNDTFPGCEKYTYDSYDYWDCSIRTIPYSIYHYSGTCKMGSRKDRTAVVDPKLKVIGIDGLRVADASIMPDIISAHTNIPVYMIAEKAADMIKEEWKY